MKERLIGIDDVIGQQIRVLREQAGVPREFLVLVARRSGMDWKTSTLQLIESGRRRLTTGELFLMPHVLTEALGHERTFELQDLVPHEGTHLLALTPHCKAYPVGIHELIQRLGVFTDKTPSFIEFDPRLRSMDFDEVTIRAAKVLSVSSKVVADAAGRLWNRSLMAERDRRLQAETDVLGTIQARRGHIVRALQEEIRSELGLKPKRTTTTRRKK